MKILEWMAYNPFIGILCIVSLMVLLYYICHYCSILRNRHLYVTNKKEIDYKSENMDSKGIFLHTSFLVFTSLAVIVSLVSLPFILILFMIAFKLYPGVP